MIVAFLFWGFNILMGTWAISYWASLGQLFSESQSAAEQAGAAIGSMMGTGMLLSIWLFGAIILGLMMLFTRGKKVITSYGDND